jgi:uncharacterized damage-inducible protein DinB
MNAKASLKRALLQVRSLSEELLASFKSAEDWTYQVFPGANHALWFAGHMAVVDNHFIAAVDPGRAREIPVYERAFGKGSKPTNRSEDYPPPEEVLETMRQRRSVFLELLAAQSDEDLSRPTRPGSPGFLPDVASVFELAAWHEGLHAGQMSVARRALGHPPVH